MGYCGYDGVVDVRDVSVDHRGLGVDCGGVSEYGLFFMDEVVFLVGVIGMVLCCFVVVRVVRVVSFGVCGSVVFVYWFG